MLVAPKSRVLIDDLYAIFEAELRENLDLFQARKGRYVINAFKGQIMEALVLSETDDVIDGFCGHPCFGLPWKSKAFIEYLTDDKSLYESKNFRDTEFFDRLHWSLDIH